MDEKTFNEQYDKARFDRAQHNLDQIMCFGYFNRLSANDLWEALVERIEEEINIEAIEMDTILGILADRLATLEEITAREAGD